MHPLDKFGIFDTKSPCWAHTHGIANKGFSGMRASLHASILCYLDRLTNPQSLTGHTINRYIERDSTDWTYGKAGRDKYFSSDMGVVGIAYKHYLNQTTIVHSTISISGYKLAQKGDSISIENNMPIPFYRNNSNKVTCSFSSKLRKKINIKNNFKAGIIYDLYHITYNDSAYKHNLDQFIIFNDVV